MNTARLSRWPVASARTPLLGAALLAGLNLTVAQAEEAAADTAASRLDTVIVTGNRGTGNRGVKKRRRPRASPPPRVSPARRRRSPRQRRRPLN